jgi:hypothetical protein
MSHICWWDSLIETSSVSCYHLIIVGDLMLSWLITKKEVACFSEALWYTRLYGGESSKTFVYLNISCWLNALSTKSSQTGNKDRQRTCNITLRCVLCNHYCGEKQYYILWVYVCESACMCACAHVCVCVRVCMCPRVYEGMYVLCLRARMCVRMCARAGACSLKYPACNTHVPCSNLWPDPAL